MLKVFRPWRSVFLKSSYLGNFCCTKGIHSNYFGFETTLTILDSTGETISTESEIVRVVSLCTMEISEMTRLKIQSSGLGYLKSSAIIKLLPINKYISVRNMILGSISLTGINPLPHNTTFWHQQYIAVENIVRKGEIACNKQYLLFFTTFLPDIALIFHFKCTLKYRLQFASIRTSLKFCRLVMG